MNALAALKLSYRITLKIAWTPSHGQGVCLVGSWPSHAISNGNIELKHWYWCWTLQCWKIHFLWLITLDECYVHFHAQEAKIKIKQWKHSFWLPPNTKTLLFVRKIMFTVIWDCHGVILTDYFPRGCTIFCMCYQSLLQKLRKWSAIDVGCCSEAFLCFMTICQLMELMSLPLASSARIKSCPHSPFSPGLALSDFFVFLEKSASWTYFFSNDWDLITELDMFGT